MGGCASTEQEKNSKHIDKILAKDRNKQKKEVKLLLLGTGASGKSTIAKQMRIIHLNGFDDKDRSMFKEFVLFNVLNGMKSLVRAADKFGNELAQEHQKIADELRNATLELESISIDEEKAQQLKSLWESEPIKETFKRSNEFQIDDAAPYFFGRLDEISKEGYIPNVEDVLNVRIKSTGLKEIQFPCKSFIFRVVDVGGQRSERRKWIHCFQEVTAILFVIALNDYARLLEEDQQTNRMHEALELFEQVINNRWFLETNIILFLNKKDLMEQRIKLSPLTMCFPDYQGKNEYGPAVDFIRDKFLATNKTSQKERSIYYHQTCATDTQNIKVVWNAVHEISVRTALKESNLL